MRTVRTIIFLSILIVTAVTTAASTDDPLPWVPETVGQGEPLTVILHPAPADLEFVILLQNPSGLNIRRTKTFRYSLDGNATVHLAIFGISSVQQPGTYTLLVRNTEGEQIAVKTVEVVEKPFFEETIPLNTEMTALRSEPTPQKTLQSENLYLLLTGFDGSAVHHASTFTRPVGPARISSDFGSKRTFVYSDGSTATTVHYGTDYAVSIGTPVHASGAGRVVHADFRVLTGNSVVIEHLPGVFGLYYHLDSLAVKEGDLVAQGQLIGRSGMTGLVTGAHLHFEFRIGAVAVDPDALIRRGLIDKKTIISIMDRE